MTTQTPNNVRPFWPAPAPVQATLPALPPAESLGTSATVAELADLLVLWVERLRVVGSIAAEEIPSDAEVRAWIGALFTDRGGRLRRRKSLPKGTNPTVLGLQALLKFHGSGGNLEGLFYAKWQAGEDWPKVETFGAVLLLAFGKRSHAVEAWARTGLVGL